MKRRVTILPLLLLMLIASIGMPVNVHSCAMAGSAETSQGCAMCSAEHQSDDEGGCCDNQLELERSAPATTAKAFFSITPPQTLAPLPWRPLTLQLPTRFHPGDLSPANGPPPGLDPDPVWLLYSSLLL